MFARIVNSVRGAAAVVGLAASIPVVCQTSLLAHSEANSEINRKKVLIVGGGTAGTTVANQFCKKIKANDIVMVEPSQYHYYQPLWSMVGGGMCKKEDSKRKTEDFLPKNSLWIKDAVKAFEPEQNSVTLQSGKKIQYDVLVVATGLKIDWNKIPGLTEALDDPNCPVASIYNYQHAEKTNNVLSNVTKGEVIFTQPVGAIKCGGAPQKIMWMWESEWRKSNVRQDIAIAYSTPLASMFAVKKYSDVLQRLAAERGVEPLYGTELVAVDGKARRAMFRNVKSGETTERAFDALHVAPPMSAPEVIKESPLAAATGFVAVDKGTLRHERFHNVFALGDCANLPTSKTAAAISSQAPVVAHNVHQFLEGKQLTAVYDGYTSCPILVGDKKLILAEFKYDGALAETFSALVDQGEPSRAAYLLKRYVFPTVYWWSFLPGTWYGPRAWFAPSFPDKPSSAAVTVGAAAKPA